MNFRFVLIALLFAVLCVLPGNTVERAGFSPEEAGSAEAFLHISEDASSAFLLDIPQEFTIVNERGETLSWDMECSELIGSMQIERRQFIVGGSQYPARLLLTVPFSESFTIEISGGDDPFRLSLTDSGRHVRIVSSGLKSAQIEGTRAVTLEGENLDFEVAVDSGEENSQQELTGHAEGKVLIENQNGSLKAKIQAVDG